MFLTKEELSANDKGLALPLSLVITKMGAVVPSYKLLRVVFLY